MPYVSIYSMTVRSKTPLLLPASIIYDVSIMVGIAWSIQGGALTYVV